MITFRPSAPSRQRLAAIVLPVSVIALLGTAPGCLDEDTSYTPPKLDQQVQRPDGPVVDKGLPAPILELGNIPNSTCGDKVGIRGRATPGVNIVVQGGSSAGGVIGTALPSTGSFCIPVTLRKEELNHLQVMAHDEALGFSKPTMVSVQQLDCSGNNNEFKDAGVAADAGPPENIAYNVVGKSKDTPEKGNHGFLTDGKLSTWVSWKGAGFGFGQGGGVCNWCAYKGWVMLTLPELAEIDSVVIHWRDKAGSGTDYGKEYKLLYSAVTEPPDPNLDDGFWTVAKDITEGNGGEDSYNLKSIGNPLMRHVALWLDHDALPWTQENLGHEVFAIAEIEVYKRNKSSKPVPTTPTVCQGF